MFDGLGWVATALFATSYFCKTSRAMRRVQALAALLWVGYGVWMNALPIIVANLIVATLALYSNWKERRLSNDEVGQPEASYD
jgi:Bacterial inner membrane protein